MVRAVPLVSASVRAVPEPPRYLTQAEAAEYLRVSVKFLSRETAAGRVAASRLGRRLVYDVVELDEYVRRNRTTLGEDLSDSE